MARERNHDTHGHSLHRSGRPPKLDKGDRRRLGSWIVEHPFSSWDDIAKEFGVGKMVIQRAVSELGIKKRKPVKKPMMDRRIKRLRREWAAVNAKQDWRRVVFAGEVYCTTGQDVNSSSVRHRSAKWISRRVASSTCRFVNLSNVRSRSRCVA